jgi:hypothetical protein
VRVVVVDLDSTLCDTQHRRELAPVGPDRLTLAGWEPYSLGCPDDAPIESMIKLVHLLSEGNVIYLLSARNAVAEKATTEWLVRHGVKYDVLRLRGADEVEPREPSAWKIKVLEQWLEQGVDIQLFIDDWADTCTAVEFATGISTIVPMFRGDYLPGH